MTTEMLKIELLVKAQSWDEVIKLFKDELYIEKGKQNNSDRDIDGLFLVQVELEVTSLTVDFFEKIKKSKNFSIVSNPQDNERRDQILREVYIVETHFRKLLLHVSDIVENYYDCFAKAKMAKDFAKKKEVIMEGEIDPITSRLTFDEIIGIMELDLSWGHKNLTASDLLGLFELAKDTDDIKGILKDKIKVNTVWDNISKSVLSREIKWEDIAEDIHRIKQLRNRAAHFNVLTEDDQVSAHKLASSILRRTKKKETLSQGDIEELRKVLYPQFSEAIVNVGKLAQEIANYNIGVLNSTGLIESQLAAIKSATANYASWNMGNINSQILGVPVGVNIETRLAETTEQTDRNGE